MADRPFIDREKLIDLVREHPVLWDKNLPEYKQKPLRDRAWRDICCILNENFTTLSRTKRTDYQLRVAKTWTRTRDSWVRTINPKNKKQSMPYAHHKRMLFLLDIVTDNLKTVNQSDFIEPIEYLVSESEEEHKSENETETDEDVKPKRIKTSSLHEEVTSKRKNRDNHDTGEEMVSYASTYAPFLYEDRHFCFFQSIQPTLALLDDDKVLEFQSGVISLLQRIKGTDSLSFD